MSKFAGNIPRTFKSFRKIKRGTQKNKEERFERDLCDQDVSTNLCPARVEVPETNTSPAKTLTNLQGFRTSVQAISRRTVGVDEQLSRSDNEVVVGEYCT